MDPNQAANWIDRLGLPVAILIAVGFVLWKVINWMRDDFKERDAKFTSTITSVTQTHAASVQNAQQSCHDHQERMLKAYQDMTQAQQKEHKDTVTLLLKRADLASGE